MTRLRHFDHLGTVCFTTFSTFRREPAFTTDTTCQLFIDHLAQIRDRRRIKLLGYVIMPEHIHLVFWPPDDSQAGRLIGELKSRLARAFFARHSVGNNQDTRAFWQRRCYDHNCRTPESVWQKVEYCHKNPVRRGLVASQSDRRWSSYNWYEGSDDVPIAMDVADLEVPRSVEGNPQQAVGHQE